MAITLITTLKRRSGMSKEDFIAYYEAHHRRIGEEVLAGYATRYVRRFLFPLDGADHLSDFDVVMEIDFPNADVRDQCFAALSEPATAARICEDEEKLFDRSRTRCFMVEDYASDMSGGAANN